MSKNLRTGTAEYYVDPTTDGYPDDKVPLPPAIAPAKPLVLRPPRAA